ncbi:hypothetical protein [Cryptosporidium parvum Iowa II]|uniref:Uncharacterized protein n=2 Tax=Cryptosporidium parvum TaxID=5807 RepID=Q5CRH9_CRYPI|nr:hypothetical protein [Cryptosporidium parvum Iowa II]EAK87987.1 hypothetical protein with a signal peptide [Cryptosporidium parvum Iowa II]QOY41703.1 Uncharacterized protein CPATCC_0024520 [Cryptosporidium parvum]WKS77925.1 putative signal peptide-containing protein [Cryptosporidium sp. 43IA8]WRK32416.1 Uncharacterized protein cpbgf_5002700 [Cryptosporidium parvum]|eukprot:QOY41703.1 hypothetical protein CPATCC_002290 [Cryptosporidium parvum]
MNLIIGKGRKLSLHIMVLALILVIQLTQCVKCLDITRLNALLPGERYNLYTSLSKKRASFLELYLIEEEKNDEEGEPKVKVETDCMLSVLQYKLVDLLIGDRELNQNFDTITAKKCLRKSLSQLQSFYVRFFDLKLIYKPNCFERACFKKPEKVFFKNLENLALSMYFFFTVNNLIKEKGGFSRELALPQELEHKNEAISVLNNVNQLHSYKEGLKVCMKFNMLDIMLYPRLNNKTLLSEFKIFSSIVRILTANVEKHVRLYKYNKNNFEINGKKNYSKKLISDIKNIRSSMKLLSYVILTKYFIIADIFNLEIYEQIYNSIINTNTTYNAY